MTDTPKHLQPISSDYLNVAQQRILVQMERLNPNRQKLADALGTHRTTLNRYLKDIGSMPVRSFFVLLLELKINPQTLYAYE